MPSHFHTWYKCCYKYSFNWFEPNDSDAVKYFYLKRKNVCITNNDIHAMIETSIFYLLYVGTCKSTNKISFLLCYFRVKSLTRK